MRQHSSDQSSMASSPQFAACLADHRCSCAPEAPLLDYVSSVRLGNCQHCQEWHGLQAGPALSPINVIDMVAPIFRRQMTNNGRGTVICCSTFGDLSALTGIWPRQFRLAFRDDITGLRDDIRGIDASACNEYRSTSQVTPACRAQSVSP